MAHIRNSLYLDPIRIHNKLQTNISIEDRSFLQLWSKNSPKEGSKKV